MVQATIESEMEIDRSGLSRRLNSLVCLLVTNASRLNRSGIPRMARATRSGAAQHQEKDKHSDSSRQKHPTKKRKRTSLADNDDQPPLKLHQPENGIINERNSEQQQKPPFRGLPQLEPAGDTPLVPTDAQKILDILELSVASHSTSSHFTHPHTAPTHRACWIECFPCPLPTSPNLALQSLSRGHTPCAHCSGSHHSIPSVYSVYVTTVSQTCLFHPNSSIHPGRCSQPFPNIIQSPLSDVVPCSTAPSLLPSSPVSSRPGILPLCSATTRHRFHPTRCLRTLHRRRYQTCPPLSPSRKTIPQPL